MQGGEAMANGGADALFLQGDFADFTQHLPGGGTGDGAGGQDPQHGM